MVLKKGIFSSLLRIVGSEICCCMVYLFVGIVRQIHQLYTGMDKTSLDTSSGTLFVRDSLTPRHVERNYVPLFGVTQSNVDLRNYVISRQIVI